MAAINDLGRAVANEASERCLAHVGGLSVPVPRRPPGRPPGRFDLPGISLSKSLGLPPPLSVPIPNLNLVPEARERAQTLIKTKNKIN